MQYEIKSGESIIDVAVKLYGSQSYVIKLIQDNPTLDYITNSSLNGIIVTYDETLRGNIDANLNGLNQVKPIIDNSYFIKGNQSLYDLSTQYGYGIDKIIEFIQVIGIANLNVQEIQGKTINVTKRNEKIANNLTLTRRILATGLLEWTPPNIGRYKQFQSGFSFEFQSGLPFEFNKI
jgi:hypothetical protein